MLSLAQIQQFKIDGYLVLPKTLSAKHCESLVASTEQHLRDRIKPFELEASTHYPGAPESKTAQGGDTIRRLLLADRRIPIFSDIAHHPDVTCSIQQILDSRELWLNPNHHNCVMTKQPKFSSETLWHRDTRYWNFNNKYLINAWFALRDEQQKNGAMRVLPGSHRWDVQDDALDEDQFLLLNHPDNQDRLITARTVEMNQGDVLLFSAHCFHAAGKNQTDSAKFSLVYTYHGENTHAIEGSGSNKLKSVKVID